MYVSDAINMNTPINYDFKHTAITLADLIVCVYIVAQYDQTMEQTQRIILYIVHNTIIVILRLCLFGFHTANEMHIITYTNAYNIIVILLRCGSSIAGSGGQCYYGKSNEKNSSDVQ